MAPGAFALKLGEVIDDALILKCANKNPKNPFQNGSISLDIYPAISERIFLGFCHGLHILK